jgi:hypothetical protein
MTRLPQLEQELVAAAARLQSPRRIVGPASRAALATAAVLVAVVVAVVLPGGDGGSGRPQAAGALPFPPNATLEDMFGVFRQPATPADDMGFTEDDLDEIPDLQPGEDPTRARRVEWPGASIFLWPMRDGVCYGVRNAGGCLPLDHLRRVGVSVGTQSNRQPSSVSGVVVDGIREVVLTASGGPDLHVTVSENFFFVDLDSAAAKLEAPGWETRVQTVRWRYSGEVRSFNVGRLLHDATVPPVPSPPGITDGAPIPDVEPLAGSVSDPLEFTVGGTRYTAVGFQTAQSTVCATLTKVGAGMRPSTGCLRGRLLRDALARQPAHHFAGGGGGPDGFVRMGFARADAVELTPVERTRDVTVILSEPWRPGPWKGEPIRFFFAFDPDEAGPREGWQALPLTVRLSDGRIVQVP